MGNKLQKAVDLPKQKKTKSKKSNFKALILAMVLMVLLASMAYCAFVTVVLADGKQNLYLAAPTVLAIFGIMFVAVFKAASTFNK